MNLRGLRSHLRGKETQQDRTLEYFLQNSALSIQCNGKAPGHKQGKDSDGESCLKTIKPLRYAEHFLLVNWFKVRCIETKNKERQGSLGDAHDTA